jgi:D-beta-D-heptose 7-phosphate kinase / D-beta-D-heptose 1-phosphate adenosyltransferase
MTTTLPDLVDRFAGLEVAVIGEAMLDVYLEGTAERLCREAPVPVVSVHDRQDAPGGAANTAANVRSLGAQTSLLSVTGNDNEGSILHRALEDLGVDTTYMLSEPSRRTLAKQRVIADGQVLLRFDHGSAEPVGPDVEEALVDRLTVLFPRLDALIISDYGYGILTPRLIRTLAELQSNSPRVVVVDAKEPAAYRSVGAMATKPNYSEAIRLLGTSGMESGSTRTEQIASQGKRLLDLTGARVCAVTLDTEGALVFERGRPAYRVYARPQPHSRAAGAGDTFTSALTLALAAGADTPAAVELASAAASVVIGRAGTRTCSAQDVIECLSLGGKYLSDANRLAARAALYHRQGRRIVFTNGCFDILHRGHITSLNQAKALGDVLIVGVNTDAGIGRLKGAGRPINTLEDRVQVLTALSCVDHIVAFDDDLPENLIRVVRPDVFVKGGNYTRELLPEASLVEELGGSVAILPYVEDHSTTAVIERIRRGYSEQRQVPTVA